jgi:predicted PurR-regulated permease PerM
MKLQLPNARQKEIISSMSPTKKVTVNIANRTILRAILWVVASIVLYKTIGRISHVITLIFAAFFLALALNPIVSWISSGLNSKSRVRATAGAYFIVVGFLIVFFALVIPPLERQTRDFIKQVPQTVANFQSQDSTVARTVRKYKLNEKINQGARDFASHYSSFGTTVLDTGKRVAEAVASVFAVLVMAFMMLVEGPKWLDLYFETLPAGKRQRHRRLALKMYKAVSGYVNGQVIIAAVAGFFAFIALEILSHILHVPSNAAALAGIVTVFGIIPLFGNPIAATLVVVFSLLNSVSLAIAMAIYFVIYFFVENHTFQPIIQSRLNELTPLMVFIAALVGVSLGGILGAIAAIPVASAIKILAEEYYKRHTDKSAAEAKCETNEAQAEYH